MQQINLSVYTNLDNHEETNIFKAIKNNNVIKYIDLENNIMVIDTKNNTIKRENNDYLFNIDFNEEKININVKSLNKIFVKEIETIHIKLNNNSYTVRYKLKDEGIVNEYYLKF